MPATGERMRLLLATMSHETNTFSPVPTRLDRFCRDGTTLLHGQAAIDFYRGTGTCMGGYLCRGGGTRRRRRCPALRQRAAKWPGGQRRLRDLLPHDHRRRGARRLRRAVAGPARRHGHRALRRRRGRTAAPHPRHRPAHAALRRLRHARQCFRCDGEQRADRHRLPDLSAHRPDADRGARCPCPAARDAATR